MEQIRILQIVEMLNENSGVSAVVLNYYQHMDQERFQMDFMVHCDVDPELKLDLERRGSRIYQMPYLSGRNIPQYKKELDTFFKQHQGDYQIVHGHLPNAAPFYMKAAQKYGVKIRILHSHNSRGSDSKIKAIRNYFLNHQGVACSNTYFACSQLAANYLFGKKKAEIIYNAIELDRFAFNSEIRVRLRKEYKIEDRIVIGHIGRFAPQKNHEFLIELAKKLKEYRSDFVFLLVGDGKLRTDIQNRIGIEGLEQYFILTGSVQNPQNYYQMMDAFILPSHYEGLPVVGVEAQVAGLPCYFSDAITEEVALTDLVKRFSLNTLTEWIEELKTIEVQSDRTNISYADEIREKKFDIAMEAKRLEEKYQRLVGKTYETN